MLTLDDVAEPAPGPGEVLLEVRASSVNHLDVFVRRGIPGLAIPLPHILGSDAAGIVRALGAGIDGPAPGTRVCVNPGSSCGQCEFCAGGDGSLCLSYRLLGEHRVGAQAELVCVPADSVHPIPDRMTFEQAAAAPLVYLTAWRMLVTKARLHPGMTVLVLGAGAGVGTACIQIARLNGATVYGTGSTPEKRRRIEALGAAALDPARPIDSEIRSLTARRGVDVVVDYVGRDTWATSLRCLRRGGMLVTCGATTGFDPVEDLRHIFYRQLTIAGSTMGSAREFADVWRCLCAGTLTPVIDRILPLADVVDAHRLIESRAVFGKIVLAL